ncbi:MAG: transglutaminase-like domain-containing protein [Oscillibacter sp.]
MKNVWKKIPAILLVALLLSGCGQRTPPAETGDTGALGETEIADGLVPLTALPPMDALLTTTASGVLVQKNDKAAVDYSNTKDGYVMVQWTAPATKKLKAQVKGPAVTYVYDIAPGGWIAFPLSDGNGSYQVTLHENVTGTKYATVLAVSFSVTLTDEFAPFLRPNQYVDYAAATKTIAKAKELTRDKTDALEKVAAVYDYVITTLSYDKKQAAAVQPGYLPVLDTVLAKKAGICFDYAALMTGMLRSQGVPCKMVVGYAGTAYHAWISVWSEETGWIDQAVYFDGTTWQRMDPTFASSGKQSASILKYIGDGSHYTAKYLY